MNATDTCAAIATTTIRRRPSSCESSSGILRDHIAPQKLVDVVLHMQNVVLDHEPQRHRLIPGDQTQYRQSVRTDAPHQPREKRVVFEPEVDDAIPLHPAVAVQTYPIFLRVSGVPNLGLHRAPRESDVIVGGGIDQVPQLFLGRPLTRASW